MESITTSELFYLHLNSIMGEFTASEVQDSLSDWVIAFCGYKSAFKIHLLAARDEFADHAWALLLIDQYLKEINNENH